MAMILLVANHWVPITNLNRLLGSDGQKSYYCYRCLNNYYTRADLETHQQRCYATLGQQEVMPKPEEAFHTFNDHSKTLSPPYILYLDIECLLKKETEVEAGKKDKKTRRTRSDCGWG